MWSLWNISRTGTAITLMVEAGVIPEVLKLLSTFHSSEITIEVSLNLLRRLLLSDSAIIRVTALLGIYDVVDSIWTHFHNFKIVKEGLYILETLMKSDANRKLFLRINGVELLSQILEKYNTKLFALSITVNIIAQITSHYDCLTIIYEFGIYEDLFELICYCRNDKFMVKEFRIILISALIVLLRFTMYSIKNKSKFLIEVNKQTLACYCGEVGLLKYIPSEFNVNKVKPQWALPQDVREWIIDYQLKAYNE